MRLWKALEEAARRLFSLVELSRLDEIDHTVGRFIEFVRDFDRYLRESEQ